MKALLRRRIVEPLKAQLTQGVTPGRLATALALGAVMGVVPILGATTLLCGVAAVVLKLNQPAVQVANFAAYPLQLVLFVPFFHAGAWLFGRPEMEFTVKQLRAELNADRWGTLAHYAGANVRAVIAWAVLAPFVGVALYLLLRPVLRRVRPTPP
ncbi:MAG: DUF2062 domain-containing protein [Archangium sp.]|nr:DUF2062 domain-containing protein [Archangium sp.]